jgi:hypothetical protein
VDLRVHRGDVGMTMTVRRCGGRTPSDTTDLTIDAMEILVEAQLSLVRRLIRELVRAGAPPAALLSSRPSWIRSSPTSPIRRLACHYRPER